MPTDPTDAAAQVLSPSELRRRVRESLTEIIEGILQKAKEGSYLHARFLCEFAGIAFGEQEESGEMDDFARRHSLGALLRERLVDPPPGLPRSGE